MKDKTIKRVLPSAFNSKEKMFQVKLAAPVSLKRSSVGVNCYMPEGTPYGRYLVQNTVLKSAGRAYEVTPQVVIISQRNNDFNILIKNVEGSDYQGQIYLEINEAIAEAISF